MSGLAREIAEVEARIASQRVELRSAVDGCEERLRERVASVSGLGALVAVGFVVGMLLQRPRKPVVKREVGVAGLLLSLATAAIHARYGKRWAAALFAPPRQTTAAESERGGPT